MFRSDILVTKIMIQKTLEEAVAALADIKVTPGVHSIHGGHEEMRQWLEELIARRNEDDVLATFHKKMEELISQLNDENRQLREQIKHGSRLYRSPIIMEPKIRKRLKKLVDKYGYPLVLKQIVEMTTEVLGSE